MDWVISFWNEGRKQPFSVTFWPLEGQNWAKVAQKLINSEQSSSQCIHQSSALKSGCLLRFTRKENKTLPISCNQSLPVTWSHHLSHVPASCLPTPSLPTPRPQPRTCRLSTHPLSPHPQTSATYLPAVYPPPLSPPPDLSHVPASCLPAPSLPTPRPQPRTSQLPMMWTSPVLQTRTEYNAIVGLVHSWRRQPPWVSLPHLS